MANEPQGVVRFPGVQNPISSDMTHIQGERPSVCTLTMEPDPQFRTRDGTLSFEFAGQQIEFRDCRVDKLVVNNGNPITWTLFILDRRWKWQFGHVSGVYNLRLPDGKVDKDREKSPQELSKLLLEAMGEQSHDVSQLPNDQRPMVEWEVTNPASALAELCDSLGCRIVLTLDNRVRIVKVGEGKELPDHPDVADDGATIDPADPPRAIRFVCGPTRQQVDFQLAAVGREVDDAADDPSAWIPIDNLSYKPAGGWDKENPLFFSGVTDDEAREVAKATIWRFYRINKNADGSTPLHIPEYGDLESGHQILPIEDVQITTYEEVGPAGQPAGAVGQAAPTKQKGPLPASVRGIFYGGGLAFSNSEADTPFKQPFRVIRELGMVAFQGPVYKLEETNGVNLFKPAELILRCTVSIRDPKTWAWERYHVEKQIGQSDTKPRIILKPELALTVVVEYEDVTPQPAGFVGPQQPVIQKRVITNREEIDREAEHYLKAAEAEYQNLKAGERSYNGLLRIDLDGAIQQVTWTTGPGGATTQASRNNEHSLVVPPYERRKQERQMQSAVKKIAAGGAAGGIRAGILAAGSAVIGGLP